MKATSSLALLELAHVPQASWPENAATQLTQFLYLATQMEDCLLGRHCVPLYRLLSSPQTDQGLLWAILTALSRVGDTGAVPYVKRLAAKTQDGSIRERAADCLACIAEREGKRSEARTLLRGSNAPPVSSDTLLRPAASGQPADSRQLLRPSDPDLRKKEPE